MDAPADLAAVQVARAGADGLGTGGMATKITAAAMAAASGIPVLLAAAEDVAAALDVSEAGPTVGTAFRPSGRRLSARRFWLRHAADVRGSLQLDAGAVAAVLERRRSLLAAGIRGISGDFVAGDVVDLVGPDGEVVARGRGRVRRGRAARADRPPYPRPARPSSAARSCTPTTWCPWAREPGFRLSGGSGRPDSAR